MRLWIVCYIIINELTNIKKDGTDRIRFIAIEKS
jgi:hypothetical protein